MRERNRTCFCAGTRRRKQRRRSMSSCICTVFPSSAATWRSPRRRRAAASTCPAAPDRPGALRVVYIEWQTGPSSRALGDLISRHLQRPEPALATDLARRYRVEPSGVPHGYVATVCGPELLADPAAEFDWQRMI